jgi:D-alanyl-lipoteichoic acid acyltransferase DltB (MBOAT superfamily)
MSFVSLVFFVFLPVVFAAYHATQSQKLRNLVILAASYFFYGWWDYRFLFLLFATSMLDYWLARWIYASKGRRRKFLLAFSLFSNLGTLAFFKYCDFFVDSAVIALSMAGIEINTLSLHILLPAGISFYTFQTLSYTIDIYFGRFEPQRNLPAYLAFVSFFPQLVAGPIERASSLLPQFLSIRPFNRHEAEDGCKLMLWGFAKKMIVADHLAVLVDQAYASPEGSSGALLFLGTIFFAFQIYCDFSGYSDIAAGCARLFGIRLTRNFACPYFSQSIGEFWRRWHITLSSWFRDYVYIPLGGSRGSRRRTIRNLFLTFGLSGLWHGASWNFVFWGVWHGAWVVMEHLSQRREGVAEPVEGAGRSPWISAPLRIGRMARTFALVCVGWVLFRAGSIEAAMLAYQKILPGLFTQEFYVQLFVLGYENFRALLSIAGLVLMEWFHRERWNPLANWRSPMPIRWLGYTAFCWAILYFGAREFGPFIYFQF